MTTTSACHHYFLPSIILVLVIGSYHVYVLIFCAFILSNVLQSSLYFLFFTIIFIMMIWSVLATMFSTHAPVPEDYRLSEEEINLYEGSHENEKPVVLRSIYYSRDFVLLTRTVHGFVRFCKICNQIKPDRAHHCSSCGVCILKMDHHCPWLNNCIGFSNQKVFLLSLFYGSVYCFFYVGTTFTHFVNYWTEIEYDMNLPVVIGFTVAAVFGSIIGIFFIYQTILMCRNVTTLERLQPITFLYRNITYDQGILKNIRDVLGRKWTLWLVPVFTSEGDGCTFRINRHSVRGSVRGGSRTSSVRSSLRTDGSLNPHSHADRTRPNSNPKPTTLRESEAEIESRHLSDFLL